MWAIIVAGGWVMLPLILCSVAALTIILDRLWHLRRSRVVPQRDIRLAWKLCRQPKIGAAEFKALRHASPVGRILSAGILNRAHPVSIIKESLEDVGQQVAHQLERYLNTLGTIAAISPLLGLLGTVLGMIRVFNTMTAEAVTDPSRLAGGIAEALITTAAGLLIAIPALLFYRHFRGQVESLLLEMEEEGLKMIEVIQGLRERDTPETA